MRGIVWIGVRARRSWANQTTTQLASIARLRESAKFIRDRLNILLGSLPGALSQCAIFLRKMVGASDYLSYPDNASLACNRIGNSYKYEDHTPVIPMHICTLYFRCLLIVLAGLLQRNPILTHFNI